jgi:hypothetical protein
MQQKGLLHYIESVKSIRAVSRVLVYPMMIVLSGHKPVTLRVASEAWK